MKRALILLIAVTLWSVGSLYASTISPERLALWSRIQSMSHGYYSEFEWQDVFKQLSDLRARAVQAQDHEEVVELNIIESMIHRDIRGQSDKALSILERTREAYYGKPVDNLKRVYVQLAEVHARRGDEQAIATLIDDFQKSPHFDPVVYPYAGGLGRDVPLAVTRPRATGRDSITVTSMERFRTQARFTPGRPMPDITGTDPYGRTVRLSDYRGSVVLIDFWFPGFTAWDRNAPHLVALYNQARGAGFEILGVPLIRDEERLSAAVGQHGMAWPQLRVGPGVPAQFGIFGDARNFLVDRNGVIVGRDLRGADLSEAVRLSLR